MKAAFAHLITFIILNMFTVAALKLVGHYTPLVRCRMRMISNNAPKVILEKGKARLFQDGNPLIYGGAVKEVEGEPQPGDEVRVVDHMGNSLGRGVFNPFSQYRVRMMARSYEPAFSLSFEDLLKTRVEQAVALRLAVDLPSATNTVYRLINGEGDRLGGLIVDVLGTTVVAQSSSLWVERYKKEIEAALIAKLGDISCKELIWRRAEARLKQDGYTGNTKDEVVVRAVVGDNAAAKTGASVAAAGGGGQAVVVVVENGVKYVVNPEDGQKTGFYCDQRDNRAMIQRISRGKAVLDTFCYSGGFSVNAALGGATSVIAVDSSQPALDTAQKNIELNGVSQVVRTVKADALDYMKRLIEEKQLFDIVICDPPKLAPTRASLDKAKNKYTKINALGMSLVKPGGLLLTCTCSAAMSQQPTEFRRMILDAAKQSKREVTFLSTTGAAMDHPVHAAYPEGHYLTAILMHVA